MLCGSLSKTAFGMRQIHSPPAVEREGKWGRCENHHGQINEFTHNWHQDIEAVGRALYFSILGQHEGFNNG